MDKDLADLIAYKKSLPKFFEVGKPMEIEGGDLVQMLGVRDDLLFPEALAEIEHELNTIGCEGVEIVLCSYFFTDDSYEEYYVTIKDHYVLANALYRWG